MVSTRRSQISVLFSQEEANAVDKAREGKPFSTFVRETVLDVIGYDGPGSESGTAEEKE